MNYGILSFGAYIPQLRLQRSAVLAAVGWAVPGLRALASGERAVANWDEDSITLAVEAARDCLQGMDVTVSHLALASTTLPFADRSNSGVVADALVLDNPIATEDLAGSRRAATSALARYARQPGAALLVASDCRETRPGSSQEMLYGHAAAALLLGEGAPVAEFLATASVTRTGRPVPGGRHRLRLCAEERWVREEGYPRSCPRSSNRPPSPPASRS